MKVERLLLIFSFLFFVVALNAQNAALTTEQIISDIYEQLSENSETEIDFTSFYEDLMEYAENPININQTNKEQLESLQFLTDIQINNILAYVYTSGGLNTIYELQLIDGLDMTDIQRLIPFVTVTKKEVEIQGVDWKRVFRYGKHDVFVRFDKGLETKEGYRFLPEEDVLAEEKNAKKYLGSPFYNSLKYRFHYRRQVYAGVTMEKDAGEQFWGPQHKGYDFYSAHVELNDLGNFKTVVVGDYRANFGQGLVMRTDFTMGKSSYVLSIGARSAGLKKYSSTDEINFFRGAGTTVRFGRTDISVFYSNKMIDGDTVGGTFRTMIADGLHRTQRDLQSKHTVNQQIMGGNITFANNWSKIGVTGVHTLFNHELTPQPQPYSYFYFKGKQQTAGSVDYRFRWKKLNIFGETAMTDRSALATLNGVDFSPVSRVSLVALYRYFSPEYNALFANAFSESSRISNEEGIYLGAEVRPVKFWKVSAYVDSYRFPWAKFGVDGPSGGRDYLIQADYFPKRTVSMYFRFKYETKQGNYTDTASVSPVLLPEPKWQARYQLNYAFGRFKMRNQIDLNGANDGVHKETYGFSAIQDVTYEPAKIPMKFNFRFQVFDAQNFDNRIYTYEQDVLYAFSVPMIYGIGSRYYLNVKYDASRNLSFWLKLAQTIYADDRTEISSSNELIQGNRKTDFRFLVRWSF